VAAVTPAAVAVAVAVGATTSIALNGGGYDTNVTRRRRIYDDRDVCSNSVKTPNFANGRTI
jgi:hypothetical protein